MTPLLRLRPLLPLCLLALVACGREEARPAAAEAATPAEAPAPDGRLVVDFKDGTTEAEFDAWEQAWGVDVEFNSVEGERTGITVSAPVGDVQEALARIRQHPAVEAAEPLLTFTLPPMPAGPRGEAPAEAEPLEEVEGEFTPNDPEYARQWNLRLVDMPRAWTRNHGRGVVVAVLDTGIAYEDRGDFRRVPDLKGVRFSEGYDFVNDDAHANDDHGHGTHVAGTIAQATNNGEGVAGVAFEATLMPVKVLNHFGAGNAADIAEAIRWAADHGAKVINLSLGGGLRSEVMARAVAYARGKGVTVVAAAGNRGVGRVDFPAAYEGAVAVSAVGSDGHRAPYSSYGRELDIAAPGGNKSLGGEAGGILQNTIDPRDVGRSVYASYQGTSMAAPHVAGVAALLYAAGAKGPDAVEKALYAGATPVRGQAWTDEYGHGLLNAERALAALEGPRTRPDWTPLVWAAAALAAVLLSLGRRERPGYLNVFFNPGFFTALLLTAVGAFFLRWLGSSQTLEVASLPLPDLERIIFGRGRLANPLVYSATIPLVLSFIAIGRKGLRPVVAGLALGFAGLLGYAAWAGAPALAWLPFRALAVPWLVVNALTCLFVARALLRTERT